MYNDQQTTDIICTFDKTMQSEIWRHFGSFLNETIFQSANRIFDDADVDFIFA